MASLNHKRSGQFRMPRKLFFRLRRFSAEPFPRFWLRFFCRWRCRFLFFGSGLFWFQRGFFLFCVCLSRFFLDGRCGIHPLNECHGSGVALPLAELDNARVTAVALRRSRCNVVKEFLDSILLPQGRQGGPTRMNRSSFAKGHHLLRKRSNRFRFGQCCFDALMLDQRANLIREQRFAVLSRAAELDRLFLVPHKVANVV
jgi:hypothetical protein